MHTTGVSLYCNFVHVCMKEYRFQHDHLIEVKFSILKTQQDPVLPSNSSLQSESDGALAVSVTTPDDIQLENVLSET
jgi:hypothetical protein